MRDDYEIQNQVNYLLNKRCEKLLDTLAEIRAYIIDCKDFKKQIDIDYILEMLD